MTSPVTAPPDEVWLAALARRRGQVSVTSRQALTGGYASAGAERVDLSDGTSVVVKVAAAREVAALRAVAVVPTLDEPVLLAAGTGWVVVPFHDGLPLADDAPVPAAVLTMLERVHAHWRGRRPRTVPVADAAWWRELCLQRIAPAVERAVAPVGHRLRAWADDPRALRAAAAVPRTLTHGDPHRGNIVVDGAGGGGWSTGATPASRHAVSTSRSCAPRAPTCRRATRPRTPGPTWRWPSPTSASPPTTSAPNASSNWRRWRSRAWLPCDRRRSPWRPSPLTTAAGRGQPAGTGALRFQS
ncbi:phosphotransferase [Pseudonocardia benzenivorans]